MKLVAKLSLFTVMVLLIFSLFVTMPASVVFAGFTPTPTDEPPPVDTPVPAPPATSTPVPAPPATSTPVPPPADSPPSSDSGGTPVEMTPTPVPTPEAIPSLGGGPGAGQLSMMGTVLFAIFLLLGFAWWRAWQLYQNQEK